MGGAAVSSSAPVAGATKFFSRANIRPMFFCSLAVFGAITYGYDGTYLTAILEMPQFKKDYGQPNGMGGYDFPSGKRSLVVSIVQAGELVGALAAGPIGDWVGRRGTFFAACFCLILGTILQLSVAGSVGLLAGGRAVLGMGVGMLANTTPLYLSEIATVAIRAVVVGSWQMMLAIGQVVGACVGQGTHLRMDTGAYRIPIGINIGLALVLIAAQFIIPESPRWLIYKGREDKAIRSLQRINKDQDDPDLVVQAQLQAFREAQREDEETGAHSGWKSLFTEKVELRKLLIVCGTLASQQINGIQFVFSYTTTFFSSTGVNNAFLTTIIVTIIEVVGVFLSFFIVNRFGRRPLLLYTSIPMFISLFVCGALGVKSITRTPTENNVIVAMICIFVLFFNLAWGPLAWVIASECAVGKNRQKIMSLGSATFFIWAFIVAFTLPYLFDDTEAGLGTQIGWIYGVGTLIGMIFVYFCVPETSGRTLEEISEMLNARVPTRKWTTYVPSVSAQAMHRVVSGQRGDANGIARKASVEGQDSSSSTDEKEHGLAHDDTKKNGKSSPLGSSHHANNDTLPATQAATRDLDLEERM